LECAFSQGNTELEKELREGLLSPHDVASLLKLFLRELPEPLLTSKPHAVYAQLAGEFSMFCNNIFTLN
jgi:hypothetical protein